MNSPIFAHITVSALILNRKTMLANNLDCFRGLGAGEFMLAAMPLSAIGLGHNHSKSLIAE
jgi:hypothetical protein